MTSALACWWLDLWLRLPSRSQTSRPVARGCRRQPCDENRGRRINFCAQGPAPAGPKEKCAALALPLVAPLFAWVSNFCMFGHGPCSCDRVFLSKAAMTIRSFCSYELAVRWQLVEQDSLRCRRNAGIHSDNIQPSRDSHNSHNSQALSARSCRCYHRPAVLFHGGEPRQTYTHIYSPSERWLWEQLQTIDA